MCEHFYAPFVSSSGDVCVPEGASELLVQPESILPGQDHGWYPIPGELAMLGLEGRVGSLRTWVLTNLFTHSKIQLHSTPLHSSVSWGHYLIVALVALLQDLTTVNWKFSLHVVHTLFFCLKWKNFLHYLETGSRKTKCKFYHKYTNIIVCRMWCIVVLCWHYYVKWS